MKKIILSIAFLALSHVLVAQEIKSPNNSLKVHIELKNGQLFYTVKYKEKTMIEPSPLGLKTTIGDFSTNLKSIKHHICPIEDTYTMTNAKVSRVHYQANELTCSYLNDKGDTLQVIFRVSNNDIAQAYRIASPNKSRCIITQETTGFDFPAVTTTFITPQAPYGTGWMGTKPSYEEEYTIEEPIGTPSRYGLGYTFPALFHIGDNGWVLVSETGVGSNYAGTRLSDSNKNGLYTIAFPEKNENGGMGDSTVSISLPGFTSWKTLTIGETLKPIVETTSAFDNVFPKYEPSQTYQPGRSVWSWILWQDSSINYLDQKKFIDLASNMGYEYILIDNYWDTRIGYEKMVSLVSYARSKGVSVILWYNSNGYWNDAPQGPKHRMDSAPARQKEMEWMKTLGIKGIKVDFFGGDKQTTMKLYEDILTDANKYGIAVIFHGCTLSRGWERMYPNHISNEAALVSENLVFSQYHADREAERSTLYPFIRNAVSSMDYGGVFFNKHFSKDGKKGVLRKTTDAFQIATAIIYQSPIQHFGLTPNNLKEQPSFILDFMRKVPTAWDETRFIDGYPGKYCVLARRCGTQWFIAATNATDKPMKIELSLPWLIEQPLSLINDNSERTATIKQVSVNPKGKISIEMQPMGGSTLFTN